MLIALVIITTSCHSQSSQTWTSDTQIKIYHGGGMVPESQTVIIKDSEAMYIHWRMPKTDTFYFKLSKSEKDSLMADINNVKFQSMQSGRTGSISYDMPTTSIEMIRANITHEVAVGATTSIKKGDSKKFYELYNYILAVAVDKVKPAGN